MNLNFTTEMNENFTPEKLTIAKEKVSPMIVVNNLSNTTPIKNKKITDDQPKLKS